MILPRKRLNLVLAIGYAVVAIVVGGGHEFLHHHDHGDELESESFADSDSHPPGHEGAEGHSHPSPHDSGHDSGHDGCTVCQYLANVPLIAAVATPPAVRDDCRPLVEHVEVWAPTLVVAEHPARGPPQPA